MANAPTLSGYSPAAGGPGVTVLFTTFATSTGNVNVWRTAGGRQVLVRGGVGVDVSGGAAFFDAEAPFGIPATYFANQYDSDGNFIGNTGASTIQIDSTKTWIHNPFNPQGGIAVRTALATGQSVAGQIDVTTVYPVGRRAGVAITGQRRGIGQVPIAVYTDTEQQREALDAMFGTINGDLTLPPFLCVRIASRFPIPLPRPLFIAVPNPTQTPVSPAAGGTKVLWDLSGPEVDPPAPALVQALLSRNDLDAYYPTRNAMDAAYSSRLARDSDYNLAGYAG